MAQEFQRRRGYALTPPAARAVRGVRVPGTCGERLKQDFDRTLNDVLIDSHMEPIRRWANAKGLRLAGAGLPGRRR